MLPFHESLLWYDARKTAGDYSVRKVRMRGAGIAFARMLLDPPEQAGPQAAALGRRAIAGLEAALTLESPLAEIARELEEVLPEQAVELPLLEEDELRAWALGGSPRLAELASALCRHAEGVVCQAGASSAAQLWQLRTVLALDLALNLLRRSWQAIGAAPPNRSLLLTVAGRDRQEDRPRLRSERSYSDAQTAIRWATVETIASQMEDLDREGGVDWAGELERRTARMLEDDVVGPLRAGGADFRRLAQLAFENANYDRAAGQSFRVLIESIGMTAGGTRFRYLSATPDLLAALVGALSADMPMESAAFFSRIAAEWGLVVSPETAVGTVYGDLDGAELSVNARRFEKLLIDAGLASGLSDRTVLVGERAGRRPAS